jgi:3-oxoacyl-[acyl-carrier protein] reductase
MPEARTALVTGGSRGIGRAISQRLARDGFHVIVNYRSNHDEAEATCRAIAEAGGSAERCAFDVTDKEAVAAALTPLLEKHALHTLVFNAGIHHDSLLVFMSEEQWEQVLRTNLTSFYYVVRPVVKQMLLARAGRVVVVSSTSGESGVAGQVNYAAAKAGLIGAAKSLALECAKRGVLVNAVTPGFIRTEMTEKMDQKQLAGRVPLARLGEPAEVAAAVSFLASEDSSYVTGQVIRVNGGVYT